jgi:hypothetical protein
VLTDIVLEMDKNVVQVPIHDFRRHPKVINSTEVELHNPWRS